MISSSLIEYSAISEKVIDRGMVFSIIRRMLCSTSLSHESDDDNWQSQDNASEMSSFPDLYITLKL